VGSEVSLYWSTVSSQQRRLVKLASPCVVNWGGYLAGGTAVALRLGHRRSVDLDYFTRKRLDADTVAADVASIARTAARIPMSLWRRMMLALPLALLMVDACANDSGGSRRDAATGPVGGSVGSAAGASGGGSDATAGGSADASTVRSDAAVDAGIAGREDGASDVPAQPSDASADLVTDAPGPDSVDCGALRMRYAAALQEALQCDLSMNRAPCTLRVPGGLECLDECTVFVDHDTGVEAIAAEFMASCTSLACPLHCLPVVGGVCVVPHPGAAKGVCQQVMPDAGR
jgi:hypothetical protein